MSQVWPYLTMNTLPNLSDSWRIVKIGEMNGCIPGFCRWKKGRLKGGNRVSLAPKTGPQAKVYNGAVHQACGGSVQRSRSGIEIRWGAAAFQMNLVFPFRDPNIGTHHDKTRATTHPDGLIHPFNLRPVPCRDRLKNCHTNHVGQVDRSTMYQRKTGWQNKLIALISNRPGRHLL